MGDPSLLYVGTIEEIEAEKDGAVAPWGGSREALSELAYATWRGKAAPRFEGAEVVSCHGHPNPDLWYSDDKAERLEARTICLCCPARPSCDAQSQAEEDGVWAGQARDGKSVDGTCKQGHNEWSTNGEKRRCLACRRATRQSARERRDPMREAA